jgi:ketosteroid isomerase-like protein
MYTQQQLSDLEELRQLTSRYSDAVDRGDSKRYAETFTEDGVCNCDEMDQPSMHGRAAIAAAVDAFVQFHSHWIHMATNHGITELGSDRATGWCYFNLQGVTKEGAPTSMIGRYEDTYVKSGDGWLFAERKLVPLLPVSAVYQLPDNN